MKLSIRGRVLFLVLSSVIAMLLAVGTVFSYALYAARDAMLEQEDILSSFLIESMGSYAERHAKERMQEVVQAKAQQIDRELFMVGEDARFMSGSMSLILQSPQYYNPRSLPNTREEADILSGTPYIHYSPELVRQGIGDDLRQEIGLAGNFADTLVLTSKAYAGYRTSFYAGSRKGYFICVDIDPNGGGISSIYSSAAMREDFITSFDPRETVWYRSGTKATKPVFTDIYVGADGRLDLTCAMPYDDKDGFAGVVGIGFSAEDIYKEVKDSVIGKEGISFVLDGTGNIILSSKSVGILAATPEFCDLRQSENSSIADAARRMAAGESGVMSIDVEGDIYYFAFAPMKNVGWSFGTVIEDDEVLDPVEQVTGDIREKMASFRDVLRQIFVTSAGRAGVLLVPVLLLVFYGSGFMAARVTRPIRRLAEGVQEIAGGNFDKKLLLDTGDEIEDLADCFNAMTDELKEYTKNLAQATAEKEHARPELEVAAKIQNDMLPTDFPERKEFGIYALMHPAKDVGGDFYDFYLLDEDHLVITVADVSGKGVPAAIFMAMSQTILKNCVLMAKEPENLAAALEHANHQLCQNNGAAMFVTVCLGVLNLRSGHFVYADAGHCPPLLGHNGRYGFVPLKKGCMLGLVEMPYETQSIDLAPGDILFLYTDGVSEAMNEQGKLFTEARIRDTLNALQQQDAESVLHAMLKAIEAYAGNAEQSDDITMLGLQYFGVN